MKQLKRLALLSVIICVLLPLSPGFASSVQDQLQVSIDKIVGILNDPSLKGPESVDLRRSSIRTAIHERFSFFKMSQLSMGKYWNDRTDAEKKDFVNLFGQLLEATYVSKIEGYTDEKVIFIKEYVNNKKAQVYTKIVTDSVEIPIDYRLYQTKDGSWMVYDVVIEGVSLVGNYRSQFDQILQKDSYETLLEELRKKLNS